MEENRAKVSETTKQAGEADEKWWWAEPFVWTDRMLTALEEGVKGDRWFSWPNVFFAALGLFSLTAAYAAACQSSKR